MATCLVLIDLQKGFLEKEAVRFLPENGTCLFTAF